jgi:hypothetical protein
MFVILSFYQIAVWSIVNAHAFRVFPRREFKSFLGQLCRLKNTLRRALRALAPTKAGVSPLRYARVPN